MAMPAPEFKPGMQAARLVMCRFPCNRKERPNEKSESTNGSETLMIDQQVEIPTRDGKTTTFITHPERGGPFPVIIFYMDAPARSAIT